MGLTPIKGCGKNFKMCGQIVVFIMINIIIFNTVRYKSYVEFSIWRHSLKYFHLIALMTQITDLVHVVYF